MIPPRLMEDLVNADIEVQRALAERDSAIRTRFAWFLMGGVLGFFWTVVLGKLL